MEKNRENQGIEMIQQDEEALVKLDNAAIEK